MKEKDSFVDCPEQQLILYVEKEDGTYGPVQTGSFITKNYINDFFEKRQRLEMSLKEQVRKKEISPIACYMTLEDLTPAETASRVGISVRKIKKHMRPEYFPKIKPAILEKYAEVFDIKVIQLMELYNG